MENALLHLLGNQYNRKVKGTGPGVRLCLYWLGGLGYQLLNFSMVHTHRTDLRLNKTFPVEPSKCSVDVSNNYRQANSSAGLFL